MRVVTKASPIWVLLLVLAAMMLQGCQTRKPVLPERGGWHSSGYSTAYTPENVMDRELSIASSSPDALVGTDVFGIDGLTLEPMDYDADAVLTGELPLEMRDFEPKPMPKVRTRTRQNITYDHSVSNIGRNLMCTGGEVLCVTSPYGVFRGTHMHKGIDLRAPFGSPIKAFRGGKVVSAQYSGGYGYMVEIAQKDGLVARYAHMSQILTHSGAEVGPGSVIGRVGSTGRSTGPHLHFELIRNNSQVNPLTQLSKPGEILVPASSHDAEAARAALSASQRASAAKAVASGHANRAALRSQSSNAAARRGQAVVGGKGSDRRVADSRRGAVKADEARGKRDSQAAASKDARKSSKDERRQKAQSATAQSAKERQAAARQGSGKPAEKKPNDAARRASEKQGAAKASAGAPQKNSRQEASKSGASGKAQGNSRQTAAKDSKTKDTKKKPEAKTSAGSRKK